MSLDAERTFDVSGPPRLYCSGSVLYVRSKIEHGVRFQSIPLSWMTQLGLHLTYRCPASNAETSHHYTAVVYCIIVRIVTIVTGTTYFGVYQIV